jgi:hypothetical protein
MRTGDHGVGERPLKPHSGARGRSGATEAFFRTDGGDPGPVLVVYHIQKTAGTSFRRVVRANLPPSEVELVPNLPSAERTPARLLAWAADWYRSLDDDHRSRLCCVMSHWAGYLLPALDRPAEPHAIVREPVDRTLSYYHFKQRRRGPERPLEPLERLYERIAADPGGDSLWRGWQQYANWQSRCLLSVYHDTSEVPVTAGPPPDAGLWRDRLRELVDQVFVVGVQDRFEEYLAQLAGRYGWKAFVPRSKVNTGRPASAAVSAGLRETILAYNWLDHELYELGRQSQEERRW